MLSGCVNVVKNVETESEQEDDFPQLNTETTVYLEEPMLTLGRKHAVKTLKVKNTMDKMSYLIPEGNYPIIGDDGEKMFFSSVGAKRRWFSDPHKALFVEHSKPNEVCVVTIFNAYVCYEGNVEIIEARRIPEHHIQKILYFYGKKGNDIQLRYEERKGNNPPGTHTAHFDISNDPVIKFRGARIRVISSSNESITYEVLQNFTDTIQ